MTSKDPRNPRPMPTTAPSISAAAMVALVAMLIALVGCAAPTPKAAPPVAAAAATQPAPAYPAEIVAREACPARDPDYGDYRSRQMANYRQEAAAAQAQGLVMRTPAEAEASIISADEYAARGAPGVSCERITYLSDGLRVVGYLWRPTDARAGASLPLLVFHRGGTGDDSKLRPNTQFAFDRFVRVGYVVIGTQYRGNDGSEGRDELGGADLRDVLQIVRIGQRLPWVDPQRVSALGYSRGGMMALMAARAGAPYRAIATVGAPTDLLAARAAGGRISLSALARAIPTGEDPDAALRARSAVHWAAELNAPVLVLHGGADPIVSAAQHARPFAARLQALGKAHELVIFEGDTHGLQMSGTERDTRILEWFRRFDAPAR
ncbi:MAG: alpha/beta hydrolase family protein [Gammaproteobacteria bacterium]